MKEGSDITRDAFLTARTIAPYVAWMALMLALPSTSFGYAVRTAVSGALLAFAVSRPFAIRPADLALGVAVGFAVFAVWVAPEEFGWYRRWCVIGEGGTDAIGADSAAMKAIRLVGSAFVIAPAEELFFRSFLYRWLQRRDWTAVSHRAFDLSAFLWTAGLFALEHDRIVVGALAGATYGILYVRRGISAAVAAHVTTNLVLGAHVLATGAWALW